MRKIYFVVILLYAVLLQSFPQDILNESFIVTHGPYLQNLNQSEVTIVWTTNKPAVPGINLASPDGKKRFIRNSHDGIIDGGGTLHKVRVDGLEPGKTYNYSINSVQILKYQAYKVYYGDTLIQRSDSFLTPSSTSDKVSFVVINDVHNNSGKMASYLKNESEASGELYFLNGDMVDYLQSEDELFPGFVDTAVAYFAKRAPFYYVRGNHETRGYKARELKDFFAFKDDSFYYSFDWGPVHFVVLDCGEDKPDNNRYYYGLADYDTYRLQELEWLKKEINSDAYRNAKSRIVIIHMPVIKQESLGYGMKYLSDNFGPVLQGTGVDLMLSGHTHRNTFYTKDKSGFGYPVLVNSNNSFVELVADLKEIKAVVKDADGKVIAEYVIK
jgi:acid phosphatase type 7